MDFNETQTYKMDELDDDEESEYEEEDDEEEDVGGTAVSPNESSRNTTPPPPRKREVVPKSLGVMMQEKHKLGLNWPVNYDMPTPTVGQVQDYTKKLNRGGYMVVTKGEWDQAQHTKEYLKATKLLEVMKENKELKEERKRYNNMEKEFDATTKRMKLEVMEANENYTKMVVKQGGFRKEDVAKDTQSLVSV